MKTKSGLRYTQRKTLPNFTRPKVHSCTDFFVNLIKCNSNNCYLTKKIPRFSLLNEVLIWPGISFCSISSRSIHRSIIQTIYQWCTYIHISTIYTTYHPPTADFMKKVPSVYTDAMKTIYLSLSSQVA